jgi:hypothetical protein
MNDRDDHCGNKKDGCIELHPSFLLANYGFSTTLIQPSIFFLKIS